MKESYNMKSASSKSAANAKSNTQAQVVSQQSRKGSSARTVVGPTHMHSKSFGAGPQQQTGAALVSRQYQQSPIVS